MVVSETCHVAQRINNCHLLKADQIHVLVDSARLYLNLGQSSSEPAERLHEEDSLWFHRLVT